LGPPEARGPTFTETTAARYYHARGHTTRREMHDTVTRALVSQRSTLRRVTPVEWRQLAFRELGLCWRGSWREGNSFAVKKTINRDNVMLYLPYNRVRTRPCDSHPTTTQRGTLYVHARTGASRRPVGARKFHARRASFETSIPQHRILRAHLNGDHDAALLGPPATTGRPLSSVQSLKVGRGALESSRGVHQELCHRMPTCGIADEQLAHRGRQWPKTPQALRLLPWQRSVALQLKQHLHTAAHQEQARVSFTKHCSLSNTNLHISVPQCNGKSYMGHGYKGRVQAGDSTSAMPHL
jgi:hypothetical protein